MCEHAKGHHSQLQNGTLLILYFKSAPQTLTLGCPKRSPEVVAAVGWLEGEGTIPPSSSCPEQEEEEQGYAGVCTATCELSEVSQGDFPWLQFLPDKGSPPGCAVGALLLEQL